MTGATRGIGFEIARELGRRGATVVACSRDMASAEKAASKMEGRTSAGQVDVSSPASVKKFVDKTLQKHGRIDILVNNAGYPFDRKIWYKEFHRVSEQEIDSIVNVDLKGAVRMSQAVLPSMMKNGGVIISISSTPAIAGHTEGVPYTIAKAGIVAMTKHIALEYGPYNVRAYTLALGNIATSATFGSMTASERKKAALENAMKRWGDPRQVARIAASVAGDDFAFATGNTIVVDGGAVLL